MDLVFNKNEDFNKNLRDEVRHRLEKIKIGGGKKQLKSFILKANLQLVNV